MKLLVYAAMYAALFNTAGLAQNNSGAIQGAVRDAHDALIPGAMVTVTNVATGVTRTIPASSTGQYTAPFLVPGKYSVSAVSSGFKKSTLDGIVVQVSDRLVIDIKLEVGTQSESVTVQATTPVLEGASVTLGQVIDTRNVLDLPLNGRDALSLASLAPGVTPPEIAAGGAAQLGNTVPSVNGANFATSTVTIDGGINSAPRGTTHLNVYSPNVDSVAEFKVQTNSMSAEFGRSNGGSISVVTKSGTNTPHGTAYWFLRNRVFDANDFFSNRAGIALGALNRHQAGGTFGGPLVIPGVYNGKDKTFFFVDYEAYRESVGQPNSFTVPTALERTGDFSKTVTSAGKLVQIFDPNNTVPNPATAGAILRQPFSGNVIPKNRIDPVAAKLIAFYPLPVNASLTGNLPLNTPRHNVNDTFNIRLDHYWKAHHFFGRGSYQQPFVGEPNYFGNAGNSTNPPLLQRRRYAGLQDVYTLSPTLIVNINFNMLYQYGTRTAWSDGFDITSLGFPSSFRDGQQVRAIPVTALTSYTGLGNGAQNYSTQTIPSLDGAITKIFSRHRLKAGAEYRAYYNNQLQNSNAEGSFNFNQAFSQGPDPNQASTTAGNSIASMLMGLPASGTITNQPATAFRSSYQALYAQDDITVTRTLTLFAGVRWETNRTRTERHDRMSVLDFTQPSPIAAQVPSLNLKGAMIFRQGDQRRLIEPELGNFAPRLGLAWRAPGNMVVRAAYGLFYGLSSADATTSTAFADGFSSVTSVVTSLNDVNPFQTMSNPYPNGIRAPSTGSSLNPSLNIGQSTNSALLSLKSGQFQNWNFTLQKSLGKSLLLEAAYVGNKGSRMSVANISLNNLTAAQLAQGSVQQQLVPNPFFGVITDQTSALSRSTVARRQLLLAYPQFTTVTSEAPSLGSSIYHSFQAKVQKHMSHGLTLLASFTAGKTLTNATGAGIPDPNNLRAERSVAGWDVPQRFVISGLYELPVGHGKHFGNSWNKPMDLVLGQWQLNGVTSFQKGLPAALSSTGASRPDRIRPVQDMPGSVQSRLGQYFDTGAFAIPAAFTYGNAPPFEPDVRYPGIANYDMSLFKSFHVIEKATAQFRVEGFNIFNRAQFGHPGVQNGTTSFGVITAQQNVPRKLQLALKVIF